MSVGAPVVSNAGPLMVLAKLNLLHLLKELYGRVHIPRSVYDETVTEGMRQGHEDARTLHLFLSQVGWNPEDMDPAGIPTDLREAHLDVGERDTLALALALGHALVLMDETVGRQMARARFSGRLDRSLPARFDWSRSVAPVLWRYRPPPGHLEQPGAGGALATGDHGLKEAIRR